jgi:hypothetical protein
MAMFSFVIICFFWMQSMAYGQGLHEIRAEIQKKGARWQAGDNPLSRLSFADQQKRLGLVRPVHTGLEPRLNLEEEASFEAPVSLDWRDHREFRHPSGRRAVEAAGHLPRPQP